MCERPHTLPLTSLPGPDLRREAPARKKRRVRKATILQAERVHAKPPSCQTQTWGQRQGLSIDGAPPPVLPRSCCEMTQGAWAAWRALGVAVDVDGGGLAQRCLPLLARARGPELVRSYSRVYSALSLCDDVCELPSSVRVAPNLGVRFWAVAWHPSGARAQGRPSGAEVALEGRSTRALGLCFGLCMTGHRPRAAGHGPQAVGGPGAMRQRSRANGPVVSCRRPSAMPVSGVPRGV